MPSADGDISMDSVGSEHGELQGGGEVDDNSSGDNGETDSDDELETDDESEENQNWDEVMVPVADMLNAAWGRDNVSRYP